MGHWQHDGQRELEEGVSVELAEVGQREEADGRHQVDLREEQTKYVARFFCVEYIQLFESDLQLYSYTLKLF